MHRIYNTSSYATEGRNVQTEIKSTVSSYCRYKCIVETPVCKIGQPPMGKLKIAVTRTAQRLTS